MTAELVDGFPFDRQVARLIKLAIFDSGKTQKEVALAGGINPASMSLGMKGERPWRAQELFLIARATGVEVTDLLPHLDSNQKPFDYLSDYLQSAVCRLCGLASPPERDGLCDWCGGERPAVVVDLASYRVERGGYVRVS